MSKTYKVGSWVARQLCVCYHQTVCLNLRYRKVAFFCTLKLLCRIVKILIRSDFSDQWDWVVQWVKESQKLPLRLSHDKGDWKQLWIQSHGYVTQESQGWLMPETNKFAQRLCVYSCSEGVMKIVPSKRGWDLITVQIQRHSLLYTFK